MTYRQDPYQPQNVYRGEQYIGVMFTAEDAALAVEALNERAEFPTFLESPRDLTPEQFDEFQAAFREALASSFTSRNAARTAARRLGFAPADSCTCSPLPGGADPACPVHQGRRARGPKPPPLGPGCTCDGSGRTCPRHGAVM